MCAERLSASWEPAKLHLDDVLDKLGHFGYFQLYHYALILLAIMLHASHYAQYVFAAGDLNYRCVVPECESTAPAQYSPGAWAAWALVPDDRCRRRTPVAAACQPSAFRNDTQACDAWVFKTNNTIVAELGLACHEWQRLLVGTVHSLGVFTALLFIGIISDSIGRRTTFIMTASVVVAPGLARSYSPSYIVYVVLEYIEATAGAGVYSSGFVLMMEMMSPDHRVAGGCIISSTFALGQVLLAVVAWAIPYWRTLLRVLYLPSVLFFLYFFCLEESVRWLLSKGKKERALRVLKKAATINKKELSPELLRKLTADQEIKTEQLATPILQQVFRSRILMTRLSICSFSWITVTFVYYGLSINSVSLAGDMHVNYILVSLVEIPGYMSGIYFLDKFGRKYSIMTALLICGITLMVIPFIPNKPTVPVLTMVSKCCISMVLVSVYIFTLELFPTSVRHSLLNTCSTIGRSGSITAPLSPQLMRVKSWLPFLLFGCMSVLAAVFLLWTPETLRKRLPDTILQAENIHEQSQTDQQ